jgi:uncharacterized protein
MCLIHLVCGAFRHQPEEMTGGLSDGARRLMERFFEDVDMSQRRDYHVHMVGLGTSNSGMSVNPKMLSWLSPLHRLRALAYLSGADVTDEAQADQQYADRLLRLARNIEGQGKLHLLAFDHHFNRDGTINHEKTNFYTPNEWVFQLAEQHPDAFSATISVHPYRPDALQELERWAKRGARFVKWLPNAHGMNAADERNDDFYRLMKQYGMILLTHVGEERAVATAEDQAFGNPLLFRRPLEMGVKVVMAHCGSLGRNVDLDNPSETAASFDLFMRLMDNPRYDGLLFGDISAMTQVNRLPGPLTTIIKRRDLHHRLMDGSDYPLPAINIVIQTRALVKHGLISQDERTHLNEIYHYNPLLFDYVVKRTLRVPITGERLSPSVFQANQAFETPPVQGTA